jgi:hypothetical protein
MGRYGDDSARDVTFGANFPARRATALVRSFRFGGLAVTRVGAGAERLVWDLVDRARVSATRTPLFGQRSSRGERETYPPAATGIAVLDECHIARDRARRRSRLRGAGIVLKYEHGIVVAPGWQSPLGLEADVNALVEAGMLRDLHRDGGERRGGRCGWWASQRERKSRQDYCERERTIGTSAYPAESLGTRRALWIASTTIGAVAFAGLGIDGRVP